jgi:hypothetical protein
MKAFLGAIALFAGISAVAVLMAVTGDAASQRSVTAEGQLAPPPAVVPVLGPDHPYPDHP